MANTEVVPFVLLIIAVGIAKAYSSDEMIETKKITQQLADIKPRAVTPEVLFSITKGKQLSTVKKFPYLGPWIKKKISTSFKMYDEKLFKIMEKTSTLLEICSQSCKGYDCQENLASLEKDYTDLLAAFQSSSQKFFKEALTSLNVHRVGLFRLKKNQSWKMEKQMRMLMARHHKFDQKLYAKVKPIIKQLRKLVPKVRRVITKTVKNAVDEFARLTKQTTELRNGLTSLRNAIAKLQKEIKEISVPKLEKDKKDKEKEKEALSVKIQNWKTCVKQRDYDRVTGPFYYLVTSSKDHKYALKVSQFHDADASYPAKVERVPEFMDQKNLGYAQMYLEKQRDGKYKLFSRKHGGVLYCSKRKDQYREVLASFSNDAEYKDDGRERWEVEVYGNSVMTLYNERCRNYLCAKVGQYSSKLKVSDCTGEDEHRKWTIKAEYKFSTTKKTWNDAENDCRKWDGHIATPVSQAENIQLWNNIKRIFGTSDVWLGISDTASEGQWVSVQTNAAVRYKHWKKGEPNGKRNENCGMMWSSSGLWNDIRCQYKYNYVCKKAEYKFSTAKKTWNEAENDCRIWGGHIVTPTSQTENTQLLNGIKNRFGASDVWLGISDTASEGQWVSVQTNAAVGYTHWNKGEPNGKRNENCGMMYSSSGLWNDIRCQYKYNYICKKDKQQQLLNRPARSCGEQIDEHRLTAISQEINGIEEKISSVNDTIEYKNLEIQMKEMEIDSENTSLIDAEKMMHRAENAKVRLSTASKAFPTLALGLCAVEGYLELWRNSRPGQIISPLNPVPSERDLTIASGYNWIAYGVAAFDSYNRLRPAEAASLSNTDELVKETTDLLNSYPFSHSTCV